MSGKSVKVYHEKYQTKAPVSTTMLTYKRKDWLINILLWAIEPIENIINKD